MAEATEFLTPSELRKRRQARERIGAMTRELMDVEVVSTQTRVRKLRREAAAAEKAAAEALAAALRVYGGSAQELADLIGMEAAEIEKAVKGVTAARAEQVVQELRDKAIAKSDAAAAARREKKAAAGEQPKDGAAGGSAEPVAASVSTGV